MAASLANIRLGVHLDPQGSDMHEAVALHAACKRGFLHRKWDTWTTSASTLEAMEGFDVITSNTHGHWKRSEVLVSRTAVIVRDLERGSFTFTAFAHSVDELTNISQFLASAYPEAEPDADSTDLPIRIWFWEGGSAGHQDRIIKAADWPAVCDNYPSPSRQRLTQLLELKAGPESSRIILFTGPPGGGKTWAIRVLAYAWRKWTSLNYVADPEKLFGDHSDYLLSVMTYPTHPADVDRWKLIILEDCGELIGAGAKHQSGQGLSRLLNVADGILGQGINTLFLITSNEPMDRLDVAVTRPGRCLNHTEFGPFSAADANTWLEQHASASRLNRSVMLAELYTILKGGVNSKARSAHRPVGFTP